MTTPILGLPEMEASQNQKYLTANEVTNRIDALINLTVFNRVTIAPPGSPSAGDRYIVGISATGAWAGQENNIAVWIGTRWVFFVPSEGWLVYDQGTNERILFNGTTWNVETISAGAVPVGTVIWHAGFTAPTGYFLCDSGVKSRSSFSELFEVITISDAGNTTSGSAIITNLTDTSQMFAGEQVEGSGIPASTTILSVNSATQITLSQNATATNTGVPVRVFPYGNGDGSTTFNVPDLRGEFVRGVDLGRTIDSGRTIGTPQSWAIENIVGSINGFSSRGYIFSSAGVFSLTGGAQNVVQSQGSGSPAYRSFNFNASNVVQTSTETRPRNVALLPCIKH